MKGLSGLHLHTLLINFPVNLIDNYLNCLLIVYQPTSFRYALLVNLGKKITDWGTEEKMQTDENIDETYGVNVQFEESDDGVRVLDYFPPLSHESHPKFIFTG